jgi:hypothetical protein
MFSQESFASRCLAALIAATAGCSSPNTSAPPAPEEGIAVAIARDSVQQLGDMKDARVRHSATLLSDGTVLVAGGASLSDPQGLGSNALASAELYVSAFTGFTSLPNMNAARWGHTATLLRDGSVLIVGGFDAAGHALQSSERYLPETKQFLPGPDLAAARGLHTATRLADGRVLIVGGATERLLSTAVDPAEVYDPSTGSFAVVGSHQGATVPSAAALLSDGRVLLIWPQTQGQEWFTPAKDGAPDGFSEGPALPSGLGIDLTATRLSDGSVEVTGPGPSKGPPIPGSGSDSDGGVGAAPGIIGEQVVDLDPGGAVLATENGNGLINADTGLGSPSTVTMVADQLWQTTGLNGYMLPLPVQAGQPIDSMPNAVVQTARAWPTATALPDGSVLVIGGLIDASTNGQLTTPSTTASSERDGWVDWQIGSGAPPPTDVQGAVFSQNATTLLPSGKLLTFVSGASPLDDSLSSAALEFDGANFQTITLQASRTSPTTLLVGPDGVLLAGGDTQPVDAPEELIDTVKATSSSAGFRLTARGNGIGLPDGQLLFAGLDKLELVERGPMTGAFHSSLVTLPASLDCDQPGLLRMTNGRVLVTGKQALFEFDPGSGSLSDAINLIAAGCVTLSALPDGTIMLLGGGTSASVQIYDPRARAVKQLANYTAGEQSGFATGTQPAFCWFDRLLLSSLQFDWSSLTFLPFGNSEHGFPSNEYSFGAQVLLPDARVLLLVNSGGTMTERMGTDAAESTFHFPDSAPEVHMGDTVNLSQAFSLTAPEGSSGTTSSSATNSPVPVWFPAVGGCPVMGTFLDWSASGATWRVPKTPFPGLGLLFVATNGKLAGLGPVQIDASVQGSSCGLGGECESGYCADGVCCDTACDGTCQACTRALKGTGADGVCGVVPAGRPDAACIAADPKTCGQNGLCDRSGACALYPDGTSCAPGMTCSAGACNASSGAKPDVCDGDHMVTSNGKSTSCAPFRCSLASGSCLVSCNTNRDCVTGDACGTNGSCEAPLSVAPATASGCTCRTSLGAHNDARFAGALAVLILWRARRRQARRSRPFKRAAV